MPTGRLLAAALLCVATLPLLTSACTTLIVGKNASEDGSVMATHSNDGEGGTDPRLVRVPARDWPEGAVRPIYPNPEDYPRMVTADRGVPQYYPAEGQNVSEPVGYIPQVAHTHAYFEETYGVINEHQVGIGESTCSAVYSADGPQDGGKALLSIDELSRIALERATTAREACQIMGDLAEEYGFHGQSDSFEGGGESLMVIDPDEGFVFHILADATGTSAIWVAARVPDDSMAVVANMYTVREVDLDDTVNFLGTQNMWELAEQDGLWNSTQPKDFTKTFSDGEYAHQYYSGRRMWGAWRLASPAAAAADDTPIPPEYGNLKDDAPYPFTLPVEKLLAVEDVAEIMRSWYAGTPYDLTAGLAGGFMASPDRYSGCTGNNCPSGNWERAIGLYRTSDSYIVQARGWLPDAVGGTVWFGPHAAHGTLYVPLACGMTAAPAEYSEAWQGTSVQEARLENSGFWASRAVLNIAQIQFATILPVLQAAQRTWEAKGRALQASLDADADPTAASLAFATEAVGAWWDLADDLLFGYNDGYYNRWTDGVFQSSSIGYPGEWMAQVGFESGPPPTAAP